MKVQCIFMNAHIKLYFSILNVDFVWALSSFYSEYNFSFLMQVCPNPALGRIGSVWREGKEGKGMEE